jgi:glycosyltransferase involved in cell wall biosynthesis
MRYVWQAYRDYFGDGRVRFPFSWALACAVTGLRTWDVATVPRVDHFIANSHNVAARIRRYYGREAAVVHPWVDTDAFTPDPSVPREDFYLVISALVPYKRIDLAIEAVRRTGRRLVVIGRGVESRRLRRLAGPETTWRGWAAPAELRDALRRARALLFPGEEDFGIVPLEAMSCGTPVVAYGAGGALETVIEGETGTFFAERSVDALVEAMQRLESLRLDPAAGRRRGLEFARPRFRAQMEAEIDAVLAGRGAATG